MNEELKNNSELGPEDMNEDELVKEWCKLEERIVQMGSDGKNEDPERLDMVAKRTELGSELVKRGVDPKERGKEFGFDLEGLYKKTARG